MAKGFVVKAKPPTVEKEAEWDIGAIKERMKARRLSSVFLDADAPIHS